MNYDTQQRSAFTNWYGQQNGGKGFTAEDFQRYQQNPNSFIENSGWTPPAPGTMVTPPTGTTTPQPGGGVPGGGGYVPPVLPGPTDGPGSEPPQVYRQDVPGITATPDPMRYIQPQGSQGPGPGPTNGYGQNPTMGISPDLLSALSRGPGNIGLGFNPEDLRNLGGNIGYTGPSSIDGQVTFTGPSSFDGQVGVTQDLLDAFSKGPGSIGLGFDPADLQNLGGTIGYTGPSAINGTVGAGQDLINAIQNLQGLNLGGTINVDSSTLPQNISVDPSQQLLDAFSGIQNAGSPLDSFNKQMDILRQVYPGGVPGDVQSMLASRILGINLTGAQPGTGNELPGSGNPPGGVGGDGAQPGGSGGGQVSEGLPRPLDLRTDLPMVPGGAASQAQDVLENRLRTEQDPEDITELVQSLMGLQAIPQQQFYAKNLPNTFDSVEDIYNVLANNMRDESVDARLDGVNATNVDTSGLQRDYGGVQNAYKMAAEDRAQNRRNELESMLAASGQTNSTMGDDRRAELERELELESAMADLQFFDTMGQNQRADLATQSQLNTNDFSTALQKAMSAENIYGNRSQTALQPLSMLLSSMSGLNVAPQTIAPAPTQNNEGGFGDFLGGLAGQAVQALPFLAL